MADEAARPPRSGAELQARTRQLRSLVDSGLLGKSDVEEEVATLKSEAKAWQQRTTGAGGQLAPGEPLPPPPPPPPPAVGPAPADTAAQPAADTTAAQPVLPPAALRAPEGEWCWAAASGDV